MYGNTSIIDDLKLQYRYGTGTTRLIMAILAVFVFTKVLLLVDFLTQSQFFAQAWEYLMLPSSFDLLIRRPWTLISYMFYHTGFWHLLFNLLGIYWFGRVVGEFIGESKVVPIFLLGGIAGAILYMLSYNVLPVFNAVQNTSFNMGASGGVMALLLAGATLVPNYTFFLLLIGPVKLKWIAFFYVILDLISIPGGNAGGHITHLGGAVFGVIFISLLQRGTDLTRMVHFISDMPAYLRSLSSKRKMVVHKGAVRPKSKVAAGGRTQTRQAANTHQSAPAIQERLDAILDKINQSGYDSLSKDDKDFLFQISKED